MADLEALIAVLRQPDTMFAPPGTWHAMEEGLSLRDWELAGHRLQRILERFDETADQVMNVLRMAAELLRRRALRLSAAPPAFTLLEEPEDDGEFGVFYQLWVPLTPRGAMQLGADLRDQLHHHGLRLASFNLAFASLSPLGAGRPPIEAAL